MKVYFRRLGTLSERCILSEAPKHKGSILESKQAGARSGNPLRRPLIRSRLRGWLYRSELEHNGRAHVRLPCRVYLLFSRREDEWQILLDVAEGHGVSERSASARRCSCFRGGQLFDGRQPLSGTGGACPRLARDVPELLLTSSCLAASTAAAHALQRCMSMSAHRFAAVRLFDRRSS
jgi:hypothetical protein